MHAYHDSPIRPKWDKKSIQVAGDIARDPLDSRMTISQFLWKLNPIDRTITLTKLLIKNAKLTSKET